MARQTGPHLIKCIIDGICFYISHGQGFVRACRAPDSKRVKTAPEFAGLRRYSDFLALAAPIASIMHQHLPQGKQRHHFQRLTGVAIQGMKAGRCSEDILLLMQEEAQLICKEIREGRVTMVVHGAQFLAAKWKNGKPVLVKRRRKTAILKSGASIQQKQEFEALQQANKPPVLKKSESGKVKTVIKRKGYGVVKLMKLHCADCTAALYQRRSCKPGRRHICLTVHNLCQPAGLLLRCRKRG